MNDMSQAVSTDVLFYADDSCLVFQHKDKGEIEKQLNIFFTNICELFVDDKLSIHYSEYKTQCIVFGTIEN